LVEKGKMPRRSSDETRGTRTFRATWLSSGSASDEFGDSTEEERGFACVVNSFERESNNGE